MAKLTPSGRFEVSRNARGFLQLRHVPSGLSCGGFSHLAVRTIKVAIEGVTAAESNLSAADLGLIDDEHNSARAERWAERRAAALTALQSSLKRAFPNGAWSRG